MLKTSSQTPFRIRLAVVAALFLLVGFSADSSAVHSITVSPLQPASSAPIIVTIESSESTTCVPSRARVSRDGYEVRVVLESEPDCSASASGYLIMAVSEPAGLRWGQGGVYKVRLLDNGGPGASERLLAFSLVDVGSRNIADAQPETGFWWSESGGDFDHAGPGLGLNLERQEGVLSVNVLGYGSDGSPEWLLGAGEIRRNTAHVGLTRFSGGVGPFRDYVPPRHASAVGTLDLEFLGPARAIGWFVLPAADGGLSVQPMSLVRFRFGDQPDQAWLGDWIILDDPGPGLSNAVPQAYRFVSSEVDAGGFRLFDPLAEVSLNCVTDATRPNSPPIHCELLDQQGIVLVNLDDIAINEMRGWRPHGARVRATHSAQ